MALLINNEDTRRVLPYNMDGMRDVLHALEEAYKEEGRGRAVNRTKNGVYVPTSRPDEWHRLTTFAGGVRKLGVSAIRIKPDITYREERHGDVETLWYTKQRGTFGALVLLFSAEDGQLLAIFNDGSLQSPRVGGSAGLAARHMARRDARVVGILGSSGLARAHALAYAHTVPNLELFRVYSPTPEHRKAFGQWITEMTGIRAEVVDTPEGIKEEADIIASCTNQIGTPVVKKDWIKPGAHVTVVINQLQELEKEALPLFHRVVEYVSGPMDHHIAAAPEDSSPFLGGSTAESEISMDVIPNRHHLCDVLLGRAPGREGDDEINFFLSEGTAVQFAAMGAMVFQRCRDAGIGRELDPEWFLQPIRT